MAAIIAFGQPAAMMGSGSAPNLSVRLLRLTATGLVTDTLRIPKILPALPVRELTVPEHTVRMPW
jgi:hypothetical protein